MKAWSGSLHWVFFRMARNVTAIPQTHRSYFVAEVVTSEISISACYNSKKSLGSSKAEQDLLCFNVIK